MKIVFMGTPDFAVPSLEKIIEKYDVDAVFTQPDKPKGRGKKMGFSEVKEVAVKHDIPVYQPVKLRTCEESMEYLRKSNPDLIIVVAYGQILSKEILDIPRLGCVNLHGSLLPMYRGAAPVNWAIIKGENKSGNTTMLMDVGLDTGDMLLKNEVDITEDMTAGELYDKLRFSGADLLIQTIEGLENGTIIPEKQSDETFYAKMLNKEIGKINWSESAKNVHNLIRGLNPWPTAYTTYEEKIMKVHGSKFINEKSEKEPGTILSVDKEGIKVACGENTLVITKVQFPNSKALTVEQYINGNKINIGEKLI